MTHYYSIYQEQNMTPSAIIGECGRTTSHGKSVTFAPMVETRIINHRDDFVEEDLWYNRDELRQVRADCTATIKLIVDQKLLDRSTQCARGLEHRTPMGSHRRLRNKLAALDAVMEAQGLPWEMHKADPELIAGAYRHHSAACLEAAHQVGLRDERLVYSFRSGPICGIQIKSTVSERIPKSSDQFVVLSAAA